VLLRAIAISDDRLQAHPIGWRNGDGNSFAHHRPSHETKRSETLFGLFRQVPSTRAEQSPARDRLSAGGRRIRTVGPPGTTTCS
jgi:hypothetical protein